MVIGIAHADHFRPVKLHARDIIADRTGGKKKCPLPVKSAYPRKPRVDAVCGNAEGSR